MNKMKLDDFLLLLLNELNGTIESETRIQKLAFLAEKEIDLSLGTNFIWHHYGPYSKDVTDCLQDLDKEGMVILEKERRISFMGDPYNIKTYSLTPKGRVKVENVRGKIGKHLLEDIRSLIKQYGLKKLKDLLSYVYMSYSRNDL